MRYYSEDTVKGILEQIDSHYVKELEGMPSVDIHDSPWHTGEPTEKGWYFVACKVIHAVTIKIDPIYYAKGYWDKQGWSLDNVVAWMEIEPYKETKK